MAAGDKAGSKPVSRQSETRLALVLHAARLPCSLPADQVWGKDAAAVAAPAAVAQTLSSSSYLGAAPVAGCPRTSC